MLTLWQVATELSDRLTRLLLRRPDGTRPASGAAQGASLGVPSIRPLGRERRPQEGTVATFRYVDHLPGESAAHHLAESIDTAEKPAEMPRQSHEQYGKRFDRQAVIW